MSNVVDMANAITQIQERKASCPAAFRLAEELGHDPMIFDGGSPVLLSKVQPSTFERFCSVRHALTQAADIDYADAIAWVALDVTGADALVAVYHDVLEITPIQKPVLMVGADMSVAMLTCDMYADEGGDLL